MDGSFSNQFTSFFVILLLFGLWYPFLMGGVHWEFFSVIFVVQVSIIRLSLVHRNLPFTISQAS